LVFDSSNIAYKGSSISVPPILALKNDICSIAYLTKLSSYYLLAEKSLRNVEPNEITLNKEPGGRLLIKINSASFAYAIRLPSMEPERSRTKINSFAAEFRSIS
jgi:hypothetical protein